MQSVRQSLRLVDPAADPERFTQRREASVMLEALLGSLDTDKRTAYVLHTIEGLSAPQISAITGVKTRTIYSRLRAAKAEIEASARRVKARARNDDAMRRLAAGATSQPPERLRLRGWAALTPRIPELGGTLGTAAAATMLPWAGALGGLAVVVATLVVWKSGTTSRAEVPVLGLLPRARMELKAGRAEDALGLLRAHALADPDSPLAIERTSTMLLALCALNQVAEARRLAEADSVALPASCVVAP